MCTYVEYHYNGITTLQTVCAMDGCEFEISRPEDSNLQSYFYSSKKKQHSINVLFVVTLDGRIIYKSPLYSGKCDDQGAFIRSGIRAKFEISTSIAL